MERMNSSRSTTRAIPPVVCALLLGTCGASALGSATAPPTGHEIMQRMNSAYYYPGRDMRALIRMRLVDRDNRELLRVMTLLRWNETVEEGVQKYLLYFHQPGDVRRTSCMVWKYPDREDERWIYVRAVNQVRRVIAPEKSTFVGSDFTREDLAGRNRGVDRDSLSREETLEGRGCYVVVSIPLDATDYARRMTWVDRETYLPLRIEYFDPKGTMLRLFTAEEIERAPSRAARGRSYPTLMRRTMTNLRNGHRTEVTFEEVVYDIGLGPDDFNERRMRQEPDAWMP